MKTPPLIILIASLAGAQANNTTITTSIGYLNSNVDYSYVAINPEDGQVDQNAFRSDGQITRFDSVPEGITTTFGQLNGATSTALWDFDTDKHSLLWSGLIDLSIKGIDPTAKSLSAVAGGRFQFSVTEKTDYDFSARFNTANNDSRVLSEVFGELRMDPSLYGPNLYAGLLINYGNSGGAMPESASGTLDPGTYSFGFFSEIRKNTDSFGSFGLEGSLMGELFFSLSPHHENHGHDNEGHHNVPDPGSTLVLLGLSFLLLVSIKGITKGSFYERRRAS